jgi:aquaporin related protein
MVISGTLPPIRGLFLFPAQLLAAISAAAVVKVMTPGDIGATNTTLSPGTSIAQGVFIEMFMTAELVFVVLMLAAEKSKDTFLAPIGIGLALFVSMLGGKSLFSFMLCLCRSYALRLSCCARVGAMSFLFLMMCWCRSSSITGVYYTGGSLNPARSLGPAVASTKFPHYHWIYWVGPFLGALVASGYYRFVKFFDYEQVNPGQDSAGSSTDDD